MYVLRPGGGCWIDQYKRKYHAAHQIQLTTLTAIGSSLEAVANGTDRGATSSLPPLLGPRKVRAAGAIHDRVRVALQVPREARGRDGRGAEAQAQVGRAGKVEGVQAHEDLGHAVERLGEGCGAHVLVSRRAPVADVVGAEMAARDVGLVCWVREPGHLGRVLACPSARRQGVREEGQEALRR